MNLCERVIFHNSFNRFEKFPMVPMLIIMRFGENNVLWKIYINICVSILWGVTRFTLHFFLYYSWKRKKYKSMTYTKIKFYIILIFKKIPGWIIKNYGKVAPGVPTPIILGSEHSISNWYSNIPNSRHHFSSRHLLNKDLSFN